jgi:hypothetical protein
MFTRSWVMLDSFILGQPPKAMGQRYGSLQLSKVVDSNVQFATNLCVNSVLCLSLILVGSCLLRCIPSRVAHEHISPCKDYCNIVSPESHCTRLSLHEHFRCKILARMRSKHEQSLLCNKNRADHHKGLSRLGPLTSRTNSHSARTAPWSLPRSLKHDGSCF